MDGFTLTRKIRSNEKTKDLPVVVVTSMESQEDKRRGLEAGANAYLIKSSFDQKHLIETIETLLGKGSKQLSKLGTPSTGSGQVGTKH
jgi:two-component system chemotaxis sensor kinase CheA